MLLMTDFVSNKLISQNDNLNSCECPDFSKHCEYSHAHLFHDEVLSDEAIAQPYQSDILIGSHLFSYLNFAISFNSKVWQPPKNS